jgi:hypothetical protein
VVKREFEGFRRVQLSKRDRWTLSVRISITWSELSPVWVIGDAKGESAAEVRAVAVALAAVATAAEL